MKAFIPTFACAIKIGAQVPDVFPPTTYSPTEREVESDKLQSIENSKSESRFNDSFDGFDDFSSRFGDLFADNGFDNDLGSWNNFKNPSSS